MPRRKQARDPFAQPLPQGPRHARRTSWWAQAEVRLGLALGFILSVPLVALAVSMNEGR